MTMGQALTEDAQRKIDETIISVITEYREEFEEYYKANYNTDGEPYKYSPFELFQLQKLAILKIGMDHMKVRISNEVKVLLNDFIDQVNEIAKGPES